MRQTFCLKFQLNAHYKYNKPCHAGSFENEALENEDRSTKHPNLENEAPKTRKRRPLNLENEAPKTRKRRPQNSKLLTLVVDTIERVVSCENCSVRTFSYLLFEKS